MRRPTFAAAALLALAVTGCAKVQLNLHPTFTEASRPADFAVYLVPKSTWDEQVKAHYKEPAIIEKYRCKEYGPDTCWARSGSEFWMVANCGGGNFACKLITTPARDPEAHIAVDCQSPTPCP